MPSLLKGPIARTVASALRGVAYDLKLRVFVSSAYDPISGTTVTVYNDHVAKGWIDTYSDMQIATSGNSIARTDRRVTILAPTLAATPTLNDKVTIDGTDRAVDGVEQDAAGATWILRVTL